MARKTLAKLLGFGFGFISGCCSVPNQIGSYKIGEGARRVLETYRSESLSPKMNGMDEHFCSKVDDNNDRVIDADEAYDLIEILKPCLNRLYEEVVGGENGMEAVRGKGRVAE